MDYVSINTIAEELLQHPMLEDIQMETILGYAVKFMRTFGVPKAFVEKVETIKVEDFKGLLPCDFYKMNQVRGEKGMYRKSTDSFHMSFDNNGPLTYKLQNSCIITSKQNDTLELSYQALPTDSDGNIMIPDNSAYQDALELYIKKRCFTTLFDLGKITPAVLQNTQRDFAAAIGLAHTDMIMPDTDTMENLMRITTRVLPDRPLAHETGYKHIANRYFMRRH